MKSRSLFISCIYSIFIFLGKYMTRLPGHILSSHTKRKKNLNYGLALVNYCYLFDHRLQTIKIRLIFIFFFFSFSLKLKSACIKLRSQISVWNGFLIDVSSAKFNRQCRHANHLPEVNEFVKGSGLEKIEQSSRGTSNLTKLRSMPRLRLFMSSDFLFLYVCN